MKFPIKLLTIILAILILSACGSKGVENPYNWPVSDFTYTDHNGEAFGLKDLEGEIWIADFVFTSCDDVCLPMTSNMKMLQDEVKKEKIENVQFVSFSVDPTVDTPEILTEFGEMFKADFNNWHFLTGYSQKDIETFAVDTFKTWVQKPESGDQVIHGTKFYLIDGNGMILKDYSGLSDMPVEDIIKDLKSLQ